MAAPRAADPSHTLLAALTLPPGPQSERALVQLRAEAARGSCAAAFGRALYLIDLFDLARLYPLRDEKPTPGHELLWRGLGLVGPAGRGRLATTQVMRALGDVLGSIVASCPEAGEARVAQRLLETDRCPRKGTAQARSVALAYKAIARSRSALAVNARLRLLSWCADAFRLAAGGLPAAQQERINQCLFPLFDADPAAYFSPTAAERPPDPPWVSLSLLLSRGWNELRASRQRWLVDALVEADRAFFAKANAWLPSPYPVHSLGVPASAAGEPWDRTPLVVTNDQGYIVDGRVLFADDLSAVEAAIAARLREDRRARVALAAHAQLPAREILLAARSLRRAGATVLELAVSRVVAPSAIARELRTQIAAPGPVQRLEVIPVALALLSGRASRSRARDDLRGLGYDVRTAENQLAAFVRPGAFVLASRDGALPALPLEQAAAALRTLRQAYPGDTSLVLVPEEGASCGDLVKAAEVARGDGGTPLFPGLALAPAGALARSDGDLRPLLPRLASAKVTLDPPLKELAADQLRRCYLEALREGRDAEAQPQGTIRMRASARGLTPSGGDLQHAGLRRCIAKLQLPAPGGVTSLTASFSISTPAP